MKTFKLLLLCILLVGFNMQLFAQETLPAVTVSSYNYKYLKSTFDTSAAQPVRLLEHRAAGYDLKNSEFYEDEYDEFFVSFYLPEGRVLATYDKEGKLLRTAEKFKNVSLPPVVRQSLSRQYPGWAVAKDVYLVNYYSESESTNKKYKILLENGNKRLRVKAKPTGEILD